MRQRKKKNLQIKDIESKTLWYVVAILLVLNLLAVLTLSGINYYESRKPKIYSLGQSQTIDDVTFTVSDLRTETKYVMGVVPSISEEIISIKLSIENRSKQNFQIFPSIQTYIRSSEGDSYQLTAVDMDDIFASNEVSPSQTISGRLAYKISSRNIPMRLYVESSSTDSAPYIVRIR